MHRRTPRPRGVRSGPESRLSAPRRPGARWARLPGLHLGLGDPMPHRLPALLYWSFSSSLRRSPRKPSRSCVSRAESRPRPPRGASDAGHRLRCLSLDRDPRRRCRAAGGRRPRRPRRPRGRRDACSRLRVRPVARRRTGSRLRRRGRAMAKPDCSWCNSSVRRRASGTPRSRAPASVSCSTTRTTPTSSGPTPSGGARPGAAVRALDGSLPPGLQTRQHPRRPDGTHRQSRRLRLRRRRQQIRHRCA